MVIMAASPVRVPSISFSSVVQAPITTVDRLGRKILIEDIISFTARQIPQEKGPTHRAYIVGHWLERNHTEGY